MENEEKQKQNKNSMNSEKKQPKKNKKSHSVTISMREDSTNVLPLMYRHCIAFFYPFLLSLSQYFQAGKGLR